MNKIYLRVLLFFLMLGNNSYAMKRDLKEDSNKDDVKVVSSNSMSLELLQDHAFLLVMQRNLAIEDISVRVVSKRWHELAKQAFPEFYEFMETYHECNKVLKFKNRFETLQKLRGAIRKLASRHSQEELADFKEYFLVKNNKSLKELALANYGQDSEMSKWLFNNDIKAHPQWWTQLALLRIWDSIKIHDEFPFKKYYVPMLKMLAPNSELKDYFMAEKDFSTTLNYAIELCDRGSDEAKTVVSRVKYYMKQNLSKEAAELCDIVIKKSTKVNADVYDLAACAQGNILNWRRAGELFEKSFEINPDIHADAYKNAALVQKNLGNWQNAAYLYECALKKNPTNPAVVYDDAAYAYKKLENYPRSAALFDMAINIDPNCAPVVYSNNAYVHMKLKKYARAAELFDIAINRGENSVYTYFYAALTHQLNNNLEKAKEIFENLFQIKLLLTKDPSMISEIYKLGISLYKSLGDDQRIRELHLEMKELNESLSKAQ